MSGNVTLFFLRNHALGTNPCTKCRTNVGGIVRLTCASLERACTPERRSPVASARRKVTFAVTKCCDSCSSEFSGASKARNTIPTSQVGTREPPGGFARSMLFTNCEHTSSSPGSYPVSALVMWPIAALYARIVEGARRSATSK